MNLIAFLYLIFSLYIILYKIISNYYLILLSNYLLYI